MFCHRMRWWLVGALACVWMASAQAADHPHDIRVMSFNIRYGTAKDGENHWNNRKAYLVETVRAFDPDLLGTQETLATQRDYLAAQLDGYECWAAGRNDGKLQGEMTALFYKKSRFDRVDAGHFWLSEAPDRAGSRSWDSSLPRMVSWVKIRDRTDPSHAEFYYFNTHFDHRGRKARLESAQLLRRMISKLAHDRNVIVTGDFNAAAESEPYRALFGKEGGQASPLYDAFRTAHPQKAANEGTFSGFHADRKSGPRIDWIGCTADFEIERADIDRTQRDGRTPSDHFPVIAVLRHRI